MSEHHDELRDVIDQLEEPYRRADTILQALIAHDVADYMRAQGLTEIFVQSRRWEGDLGYYVYSASDNGVGARVYEDEFDPEPYEELLYSAFSEDEILQIYGDGWNPSVKITVDEPHPIYPTRGSAEAARDRITG